MSNRQQAAATSHPESPHTEVALASNSTTLPDLEAILAGGDVLTAIGRLEGLLADGTDTPEVRHRLGDAYRYNGQPGQAIAEYRRVLERSPGNAVALTDLGNTLVDAGDLEEGIRQLEKALDADDSSVPAMLGLLRAYRRVGEPVRGERILWTLEARAAAAPEDGGNQLYVGLAYSQFDRFDEALEALVKASELQPGNPFILNLVGVMLEEVGRTAEALGYFEEALGLVPDDGEIRFNLSTSLLRLGQLERGFQEYESRWRSSHFVSPRRSFDRPMWDGAPLDGRTILLHTEQGLGDSIQFVRYVTLVARKGGRVVVECEPALERLFGRCEGVARVVRKGEPLPDFEVHAPFMSLPHLVKTGMATIPAEVPYLSPAAIKPPLPSFPSRSGNGVLRVGIAWEGSRTGANFQNKSCDFGLFEPFVADDRLEVYSLQKGEGVAQLRANPASKRVHDLGSGFDDLLETANAISQLDLVITVDTSIAHLAGALGVPCWILLSYDSDWRWLTDRDDSPWYPTARLFRQRSLRDWPSVFVQVEAAIEQLLLDRSIVRPAPEGAKPSSDPKPAGTAAATSPAVRMLATANSAESRRLFERALADQNAQRLEKAAAGYRRVLELAPEDVEAHNNLAAVLCTLGSIDEGVRHFERAIELRPDYLDAHNNLGLVHVSRREFAAAIACFEKALAIDPAARQPLRNLTVALREAGDPSRSASILGQALELHPDDPQLLGMLACARAEQGRMRKAREIAEKVLQIDPSNYDAHIVLGNCAIEELRIDEAVTFYDRAEKLQPLETSAPWNRAYALLLRGDFERGWKDYEVRWRLLRASAGDLDQYHSRPRWDGSALDGRSILLHSEQGFGDTIHFVRYAAVLKARWDVRVVVYCQPALVDLLRSCPGVDEVVGRDREAPPTDVQISMLGLPHQLGTTLHDVPAEIPYLDAVPTGIADLIRDEGKLRVGLIWAGSQTHSRDAKRSLHLGAIEHLAATPGVTVYSLQVGPQESELRVARFADRIVNVGGAIVERQLGFAGTAAAIAELDLVISVDTSVAHLAAAMGKPVWLLLPFLPDWRWLLDRTDSPWYPSMRLFRQPRPGDWASVLHDVTREIRSLAGAPGDRGENVSVPSVQIDSAGKPRFTISLPLSALAIESRFAEFERELTDGGAHAEARAFLDAKLTRDDLLVDVGAGLGFVSLSAATAPGGPVDVLALVDDADDARLLLRNAAQNEIGGTVTVHLVAPDSPPIDEIVDRPLREHGGRVFLRIASAAATPATLAGAARLFELGRIAAVLWPGRSASQSDRFVASTLGAFGYSHFEVVETSTGPELVPYDGSSGTETIVSLSSAYLESELDRQEGRSRRPVPAPQALGAVRPSSPTSDQVTRLGMDWQLGASSGWGVYGLNFALQCLRTGRAAPVLFCEPDHSALTDHQLKELSPAFEGFREVSELLARCPGREFEFRHPMLRALGNQLNGASISLDVKARHDVGVIFFEDTRLDAGALFRGRQFTRIIAGSTWNAEVLRARGLDHVTVCLQGVDTDLFQPGDGSRPFGDRFVVFSGGKLEYRKGQDLVVAAFREFHRRHPDALLVTAWHNHWAASMADIDLRGHVHGVPEVSPARRLDVSGWLLRNGLPDGSFLDLGLMGNSQIAELVRSADVGLFPNRCEGGTNLVAMETMASGVPTILSANTGHLDLIAEDRCYALSRQDDVLPYRFCRGYDGWGESSIEEILDALERAYHDREEARRIGGAGAEFIGRLSWKNQIAQLLDSLQDLIPAESEAA